MEVPAKTIKEFQDVIDIIEKCQKVKVLVAFTSGNTAYGLPEYDSLKRFIYIFVHQQPNDKQMTTFHNGDIEAKGYSVENFVPGLGRCNITRIEIAHYPAFYIGDSDFCKRLIALAKLAFPLDGTSIQYKYSCKVLKDDYPLYYIRHNLSRKWIFDYGKMPPIEFAKLVSATVENEIIRKKLLEITQAPFNLKEYPDVWEYIKRLNNSIHISEFKPNEAAEEQANILIQETLKKYHRH